jgi:D-alanyl-D-alanine carboxypeptidase (penicillin-binding protein 5/6)
MRIGTGVLWVVVAVALGAGRVGAEVTPEPLGITAQAAIVVDHRTGDILFARNPDVQLPPASTTKLLSALVAVQNARLDQVVRVSRTASRTEPRKIWLRPGWAVGMDDLLYAMLLYSANDASVALAEGMAGSVSGFADLMNATAWRLGATRSHFQNPSGLPGPQHYSTARDLATIMHHALQQPVIREVLSTHSRVIRPAGTRRRIAVRSHNRFLDRRPAPVIGKTGWTRRAKRCFVGASTDGQHEILVSLLGSNDLWGDLDKLVEYGFNRVNPDRVPPQVTTTWQQVKAADDDAWRAAVTRQDPSWKNAAPAAVVPRSQPASSPAASAPQARGGQPETRFRYHIYVASFPSRERADQLRRLVARDGYRARVERVLTNRTMYRVTVRDFTSRDSARQAARVLRRAHSVEPLIVAVRV